MDVRTGVGNKSEGLISKLSSESREEVRSLLRRRPWRSTLLYFRVYLAIFIVMFLEYWAESVVVSLVAVLLISGRQHSLYVLNHDASHNGLYTSQKANKLVATVFSNLVMFHHPEAWSHIQWKRVHMLHHSRLFTGGDPNYVGRKIKGDIDNPPSIGRLFLQCLKAGFLSPLYFFSTKQDYVAPGRREAEKGAINHLHALLFPFKGDTEMERERRLKLVFFVMAFCVISLLGLWRPFLLLWILPMYTVYPMILMFMDLTEHRWSTASRYTVNNSRSVRYGLLGRILFGGLSRGLHREHHIHAGVVAADLPKLSEVLIRENLLPGPVSFRGLLEDVRYLKRISIQSERAGFSGH